MVKNLRLLFLTLLCAVFNVSMAADYETVTVTATEPYEIDFTQSQGQFKIEDVVNNLGTPIWTQGQYGMTATTFLQLTGEEKKTNHDGESWLVSPIFDLSSASEASLAFTDQVNKYFGDYETELGVFIREAGGSWTKLDVSYTKPSSNWGGWVDQSVDIKSYAGKKVQVGFYYKGTATTAGTYEVKKFAVKAEAGETPKEEAGLKYSDSNVVIYLGEDYTLPTLENPNNLKVTYNSNNENVATVAEDGTVTILGVTGNTTITATSEENDNFKAGKASYYLVVKERGTVGEDVFELVTDASDLADGDKIIIVNEAKDQALSTTQNNNNRAATEVEDNGDDTINATTTTQIITLEGETGAWYFNVGGGYLYAASTSGNQLKTENGDEPSEKAKVTTIEIEDGVAKVLFNQWGTETPARNRLRYNSNNGNPIFSCYGETAITGTDVRIYKKPGTQSTEQPAGLEYSAEEFTWTIGESSANELPTLKNPNKLTVTYSSTDETVATVATDGTVTITGVPGVTTIKAHSDAVTGKFKEGNASYVLTVVKPFVAKKYELVTSAKTLKAGDNIIIVSPTNDYAISTTQQKNNRTGADVKLADDYTITSTEVVADIVLGGSEDAWTFKVTNGDVQGFLYAPATGNHLRTTAELPEAGGEATIEINYEGNAEVTFNVEGQNTLRFNQNGTNENRLFSCYSKESSIKTPVRIYREVRDNVEIEITEAGYATLFYGQKSLKVPSGVKAYTYKATKDGLAISKTYNAKAVIPAGTAVVLEGAAGVYTFEQGTGGTTDANNMLMGFDDTAETVGPDESGSYKFYALSQNGNGEVGFYFMEEGGAAFNSGPHKAYLAVPADVAAAFYQFDGSSDGINNVTREVNATDDVYTISGVRVSGQLQKGIYIVNGKKVVVK